MPEEKTTPAPTDASVREDDTRFILKCASVAFTAGLGITLWTSLRRPRHQPARISLRDQLHLASSPMTSPLSTPSQTHTHLRPRRRFNNLGMATAAFALGTALALSASASVVWAAGYFFDIHSIPDLAQSMRTTAASLKQRIREGTQTDTVDLETEVLGWKMWLKVKMGPLRPREIENDPELTDEEMERELNVLAAAVQGSPSEKQ